MFAASKSGKAGPPSDASFAYAPLLLGTGSASARSTTATDSSATPNSVTRNGTPSTGWVSPYQTDGYWGSYFPNAPTGTSGVYFPDNVGFTFGSVNFTVESYIYPISSRTGASSAHTIYGQMNNVADNANRSHALQITDTTLVFYYTTNGATDQTITWSYTFSLNTWYHIAVVRSGNTIYGFVNGNLISSQAFAVTIFDSTASLAVGAFGRYPVDNAYTSLTVAGYLSNLRIIKNQALSTVSFTPPTGPLNSTTVGWNGSTAALTGTVSLLTCQSNRFIDNSSNTLVSTLVGTPQTTPNWYPSTFSAPTASLGAALFNGTTDYLTTPIAALGPMDISNTTIYTVEAWVYWLAGGSNKIVWAWDGKQTGGPSSYYELYWATTGNVLKWEQATTSAVLISVTTTLTPALNTWYHIAVVRNGSAITIYANGQSIGTGTYAPNDLQFVEFGLGALYYNTGYTSFLSGYISNFRFVKGTAVYTGAFTPPTNFLTQTGGTYPSTTNVNVSITAANTALLLNLADSNYTGATNGVQNATFIDTGPYAFPVTRSGTTTQGSPTPYWPNGYWSNYLDGSSSINFASLNAYLTTGECTVEAWVNCSSFAGSPTIVGNSNWSIGQNCGWTFQITTSGTISFLASAGVFNTYPAVITTTSTITLNTWNHVAFVRNSSNVCRIYINGVDGGGSVTYASSFNLNSGVSYRGTEIGTRVLDGTRYQSYTGYVSNVRIVNNTAVYTSTFTPPTTPLAATQSAGTNISAITGSSTSLLTCQSNRIIDNSNTNYTPTITGTPRVQSFQPFRALAVYTAAAYGGSGYFNGSTDYLTVPTSTTFQYGTNNFTAEAWVYRPSAWTAQNILFGQWSGSTGGTTLSWVVLTSNDTNGYARFVLSNTGSTVLTDTVSSTVIPLNQWNHIALVRNGSAFTLYLNGSSVATYSSALALYSATNTLSIGASSAATQPFAGYISNLRIVNGTAVYTGAFTPPVTPVTAITNTILLVNFANAAIYDAAVQNAVTTVGDAQASITQYQWSPTSIKFDGTGDYINISAGSPQSLTFGTGDFTIEFWVYFTSNTGQQTLYDGRPSAGAYPLLYLNNGVINYYVGSSVAITSVQPSINTWYFMSLRRSSGTTQFFINGTQSGGNYTDSNNYLAPPTSGARVGANYPGSDFLFGYIQDYRITKGVARPATPIPTAAFPTR